MCTPQGQCVPVSRPRHEAPPPAPAPVVQQPARSKSADSIVNLHMDVLGTMQFGLTPTVEVGKKFAGYFHLRPMNTGLMSYLLIGRNDPIDFKWGIGVGTGLHIFTAKQGNMRGFFGGPSLEYMFIKTGPDHVSYLSFGTHVLVPNFDLGYRWAFGSFLLGVGGRIGLYAPVNTRVKTSGSYTCRSSSCEAGNIDDLSFAGGIFLDLGWFL